MKQTDTSWQAVSKWYGGIVGEKGHYFHQSVIIPKAIDLLDLKKESRLLDIACGQGVLARSIDPQIEYLGVDKANGLIAEAKKRDRNNKHKYIVADVTKNIPVREVFDRAVIILALQNIKEPEKVIEQASQRLNKGGRFLIVLNHPSFRIPRQSSWEDDKHQKLQYRRVNRYMSPLEIPINAHPGQENSPVTWSYHRPLEDYSKMLFEEGFYIEKIEEWTSEKHSTGKNSKQENRARDEFPMFMAILAIKKIKNG